MKKEFPQDYLNARPAWLPNWKKESAYTDHGDDLQAWAWECLRRNPEYQADYARWAALPDSEGGGESEKYKLGIGEWTRMAYCYSNPPALSDDETAGEYERRTGIWPDLLHLHFCRGWGLESLEDPAKDDTHVLWRLDCKFQAPYELYCFKAKELHSGGLDECGNPVIGREVVARIRLDLGLADDAAKSSFDTHLESDDYLLFAFDLRDDPKRQTDDVLEILRSRRQEWQKKKKQASGGQARATLQRLRVFDAVWALGEGKQAHIASELGVTDATISKHLTEAKRLILDGGYREFLLRV